MSNINITTQDLIDEIRLMSNLKNNQYFTDDDIVRFINDAKDELFDVAVDANQHYFIKTFDFTLSGGAKTTPLPSDFYKENILEINPGTQTVATVPMLSNYLQRNQGYNALGVYYGPGPDRRYLIEDTSLTILGSNPNATDGNYRLYYTPLMPDLAIPYTLNMSVPRDVTIDLCATNPLDSYGTWTQLDANSLQFAPSGTFTIDDQAPLVGDRILFPKDDAPISNSNIGIWSFTGIIDSGGLKYEFVRSSGYTVGVPVIPAGYKIGVLRGTLNANATLITQSPWEIGTTAEVILPAQSTTSVFMSNPNGSITFYNNVFDLSVLEQFEQTTFVGAGIQILSGWWAAGQASFTITSLSGPGHTANVTIPATPTTPWYDSGTVPLADTALVNIMFAGLAYKLPIQLVPWALYIKVHASRTIRAARQQDTSQLDAQMAQLRLRVTKMAANRTEDVTQAPWLRRGRGYGGWSGGSGGF